MQAADIEKVYEFVLCVMRKGFEMRARNKVLVLIKCQVAFLRWHKCLAGANPDWQDEYLTEGAVGIPAEG